MADKIELKCNDEQYHGLSKAAFDARDGSVMIKVDKAALVALLTDHGKLVNKFRNEVSGFV